MKNLKESKSLNVWKSSEVLAQHLVDSFISKVNVSIMGSLKRDDFVGRFGLRNHS